MFLSVTLCICRIWPFDVFWYINRVVYVGHDFIFCELWDNLCAWCYCHFIVFIDIYLTIMISGDLWWYESPGQSHSDVYLCLFLSLFRNHNPYLTLNKGGGGGCVLIRVMHTSLVITVLMMSFVFWKGVGSGGGGGVGDGVGVVVVVGVGVGGWGGGLYSHTSLQFFFMSNEVILWEFLNVLLQMAQVWPAEDNDNSANPAAMGHILLHRHVPRDVWLIWFHQRFVVWHMCCFHDLLASSI